jgi:hypothetical protein
MSKLYYLIFISGENAVVKQHLDELLQIEFEDIKNDKRDKWIETDDPKIKIKKLYEK